MTASCADIDDWNLKDAVIEFTVSKNLSLIHILSAILLIVIGIMVLYEVCKPFDWKRRVLWGAMAGSSAVTILGFGGSFGLSPLGTQAFLVLLVFLGLAYSIMRFMLGLFDQGERLLNRGRHLRKRR